METARLSKPGTGEGIPRPEEPLPLPELVRRHQGMLWRYLRLLGAANDEADDLMQETFLRIARGAADGEQIRAPASFLRAVARNLLIAARRAARRSTPTTGWANAVDEIAAADPDAFTDRRLDALRRCQANLRGRARAAIDLHYVQRQSYRDTAATMGLSVQGLRTLLARTRRALRDCITRRLRGDER